MAALGALGIGLSIVFGGFVLVLLAELYYVFVWKRHSILNKRGCRIGTECNGERGNFAHEAALVGSFGGYSSSSVDAEFVAKLFPMGPEAIGSDNMFMHGVFGDPRLLFTIKEETKEDMEFEEPVKQHNESAAAASFLPVQNLQSASPKPTSESPSSKQQQQLQLRRQFSYSIGVIQQPQILRSISTKSISWTPPMQQQQQPNVLQVPSDSSSHSSCSIPSSPAHRSSSTSPSRPTSASLSPTLTSPKYHTFCSSGSSSPELFCMSKPIYELNVSQSSVCSEENENEAPFNIQSSGCPSPHDTETPFDTPMSSPSLLTPCGTPPMTPPLTPIKASKDPYGLPIEMANHGSGTSHTSSADTNPSFSSSSENCHKPPISRHPRRPSRPPPMVLPYYANASTEKKQTLMERRAFASIFNEPPLQPLPRESARLNGFPPNSRVCRGTKPGSNNSSNACSPSTPFSTAPSTPYFTPSQPNQCPITDQQAKDTTHSTLSSCPQT